MGHIDLAMTKFPEGTAGLALDAIARRHLWFVGYDYPHGECMHTAVMHNISFSAF